MGKDMDMGEMTNRIALVTGASSGIGLAAAETLAREGADVAVLHGPRTTWPTLCDS